MSEPGPVDDPPPALRGARVAMWLAGIGLVVFVTFAVWAVRLVFEVAEQREYLRANVLSMMDTRALLADDALPEPSALTSLAGVRSADAEAARVQMGEAVEAGDREGFEAAANRFIIALRGDSARISSELGAKWDAMNVIVGISLAMGLGVLGLFVLAERRRIEAQALTARVRRTAQELAVARDRAEAADRLKTRLLADVSHELRTPLVGILGGIELLRGEPLEAHQKRRVQDLHESASGLRTILDDLIDLARIDAESIAISPRTFDSRRLIEALGGLMRLNFPDGELEFTGVEALPAALVADPDRVRQIAVNLLSNAFKYAPGAPVHVQVQHRDGVLRLRVDDGGTGIPADQRENAIMPFVRLARDEAPGTGLGLAVSRGLAVAMGGELTLGESSRGGLRVDFTVPAEISDTPPPSTASLEEFKPPLRVLLVEDNRINREIVSVLLTQRGFEVQLASNGLEAIEQVDLEDPELVLMDCQMPVLDGLDATRRLRASGYKAPILALTATVGQEEREACAAAGMNAVLSKPVMADELQDQVTRWGQIARQA